MLSSVLSKVMGQSTDGEYTDDAGQVEDDHTWFDKSLFDSSMVEKIHIPGTWKALEERNAVTGIANMAGLATCYPKNGSEIEHAVMGKVKS